MFVRFATRSRCKPFKQRFKFSTKSAIENDGVLFDVIVVGGGHAGCEAASAACRIGCRTLLLTHRLDTIGEMSCNPSFGGIGKGHLMREIDALDGLCARLCDQSGSHYKVLNKRKGPAVYGLRAQIDRKIYKRKIYESDKAATSSVDQLKTKVAGVVLDDSTIIHSRSVVITTGTFLKGQIFMGLESKPAGRIDDPASYGLSKTLEKLGFRLNRLKTGTPPRLDKNTVNFDCIEKVNPDKKPTPFSFLNDDVWIPFEKQLASYITHSNEKLAEIVKSNVHLNMHVQMETSGPRYCPSLESKILRFGDGKIHQFWMELEGFDSEIVYPQGMSMTFPPNIQQKIINCVKGLEKAVVVRPGYGVHYDFIDPRQLKPSLETKLVDGLFLAGQINGTTGYEEAASQGVIAGINAGLYVRSKPSFVVNRSEGYIGVLIDDLTSLGTSEPYRMFTSRVEFRLMLRPDNADHRLTQKGFDHGVIGTERYSKFIAEKRRFEQAMQLLINTKNTKQKWMKIFPAGFKDSNASNQTSQVDLLHFIASHGNDYDDTLSKLGGQFLQYTNDEKLKNRIVIEGTYRYALMDCREQYETVCREASMNIPESIDFDSETLKKAVSFECREKLNLHRPTTIGAASRIPGMTPASLFHVFLEIKRLKTNIQSQSDVVLY